MNRTYRNVRHNKPTSNRYVYVAPSEIHAKGLFAREDIPPGTDIVEYDGPRLRREEGEKLAQQGNSFVFILDRRTCIDGSIAWNLARYANHSCAPNCASVKIGGRIWLRTLRPVARGEEITYNYGYDFKNYMDNPCACGAPDCVGYMVSRQRRNDVADRQD